MPRNSQALTPEVAFGVHNLWRIAIAAEAAGLMRAALDLTVAYVKERQQFGRPLGDFQAVQHRLAADEQIVSAAYALAMRAADTLAPVHAATAALYAQQHLRTIVYDCHQFHGAMGLTLEYPLHLWTYRLKFLQGELGGRSEQARALANLLWPTPGRASSADYAKWRKAFGRAWLGV
jgi:alkylation response protein AidB-like acyl-CoA dehydrogenase